MDPSGYQVPDLASILNTLSNYGSWVNNTSTETPVNAPRSTDQNLAPTYPEQHVQTESQTRHTVSSSATSAVDPATIIEWPAALRYVTRLAARDDELGPRIQKMIANQKENERQWWQGRETLIRTQANRIESRKKLDEVLRTVGGDVSTNSEMEDTDVELKNYDLKVHRAATTMVKAMAKELKGMGIPFFGTSPNLLLDSQSSSSKEGKDHSDGDSGKIESGKLSSEQHLKLQRKMIQYLEDMYKD